MESRFDQHILSIVTLLPVGTAVALLATGFLASILLGTRGFPALFWRTTGLTSGVLTFALAAIGLWSRFDPERTGYQLIERSEWLPAYGIHYFVGIDGISLMLVLLTTFLVPVVLLASWKEVETSVRSFVVLILLTESALLGALVSLNLFQFFLFFELLLVAGYFLIGIWGGRRRLEAAARFFGFGIVGPALMWVGILVLYRLNYEQGGALNLDLVTLPGREGLAILDTRIPMTNAPWWSTQGWLFVAFSLGFAVQIPILPLHGWAPSARVEAPTPAAVLLSASVLSLGLYGFLRLVFPLFGDIATSHIVVSWGMGLGVLGIWYGSLVAMVQTDLKRMLAYVSIAQVSAVVLGAFSLNIQGLVGAIVLLLSHGLAISGLFLCVGFLSERRETDEIVQFGGVAKPMPVFAALFGLLLMSAAGVPILSGFVGEFLVVLGAMEVRPWAGALASFGVFLTAGVLIWTYRRTMMGAIINPENRGLIDLNWRERTSLLALLIPILWLGLYPNPVLRRLEPSVMEILRIMDERSVLSETGSALDDGAPQDEGLPSVSSRGTQAGAAE